MALSGNTLGQLIYDQLGIGSDPGLNATEKAGILSKLQNIGSGIVSHITTAAVVNTTVNTVTSCPAGAGTGAGPGTGTIT